MKIVAIGCAPTTIGLAYRLQELRRQGIEGADQIQLLILEQESVPGGLSATIKDDEGFLWDLGGHITFSHNFPYYEKATREAVDKWNTLDRNAMVDISYMSGQKGINLVPYPAQFAVPLFPEKLKRECMAELRQRFEEQKDGGSSSSSNSQPENFEQWIVHHFGPTMLDAFFKPYTKKVWTVDTAKMSPHWVGTRVAKLPQEKLEQLCELSVDELKKTDFGWGPNTQFSFPKFGGTGAVWKQMTDRLPPEWFRFSAKVVRVDHLAKRVHYRRRRTDGGGGGDFADEVEVAAYDALVNSSPIDQFVADNNICAPLQLDHNKVFIVGVGLRLPFTAAFKQFTWLYFPDPSVPFYRVTFFSRYGDDVTPDSSLYWSVLCESARPWDDPVSEEQIREQTVQGLVAKEIIREDQVADLFSITLPYGYPIPSVQRDAELARAHQTLENHQIYSRGRFGGWKYEVSNQDHCFIQGKELCDRLVLGEPEKLYKTLVPEKRG